jgi:hypothetical protein
MFFDLRVHLQTHDREKYRRFVGCSAVLEAPDAAMQQIGFYR